jgi:hypothetical protein
VTGVVVGGEVVLDHGHATRFDEAEILGRAREFGVAATAGDRELEAVVRKVYQRAEESDVGVNAYVGARR